MTHTCARTEFSRALRDPYRAPAVAPPPPSHEEIARLAYAYWEARGRGHGTAQEDWYRAERELIRLRHSSEFS